MKIIFLVFVLIGLVYGSDEDLKIIDSVVQEQPCLEEGGSCTIAADCRKGQLTEKQGLCPIQQKRGVECCYGVSEKETRCEKHGGACISQVKFCNPQLVFEKASDCTRDQKCCILIF